MKSTIKVEGKNNCRVYVLRFLSVEDELCIFMASVVPFIESPLNIKIPSTIFVLFVVRVMSPSSIAARVLHKRSVEMEVNKRPHDSSISVTDQLCPLLNISKVDSTYSDGTFVLFK